MTANTLATRVSAKRLTCSAATAAGVVLVAIRSTSRGANQDCPRAITRPSQLYWWPGTVPCLLAE